MAGKLKSKNGRIKRMPLLFERIIVKIGNTYHGDIVLSIINDKEFILRGIGSPCKLKHIVKYNATGVELNKLHNNKHPKFKK